MTGLTLDGLVIGYDHALLPAIDLHIEPGGAEIALFPRQEREGVGRLEGPVEREADTVCLGAGKAGGGEDAGGGEQ